jgi:hypothetical protein
MDQAISLLAQSGAAAAIMPPMLDRSSGNSGFALHIEFSPIRATPVQLPNG